MGIKSFITGLSGTVMTAEERRFLDQEHPWGLILFARNIDTPRQVHQLVDAFRETVERADAPVLIDQEGGRVQRLRPPHWHEYADARRLGDLWRADKKAGEAAIFLHSRLIAHDLVDLGINVDCLPVLDVPVEGADDVIGDRAYSTDPQEVAMMGRIACEGLLAGGVLPVVKHIPGHGRAMCDSHKELPIVSCTGDDLSARVFSPFKALADMPLGMTVHIRFENLDGDNPATTSPRIIEEIIRGEIGFDGLLMSDDLSMEALEGDLGERTARSLDAGCDMVLHCNGDMKEMEEVAAMCHILEGKPLERAEVALGWIAPPDEINVDALWNEYRNLLEVMA